MGTASATAPEPPGRDPHRFEGRAMASPLRLAVSSDVPARVASTAWSVVVDEFEACEQAMSRFRETSELTRLNRAAVAGSARPEPVGPRLRRALVAADRARRVTDGRFDPRVLAALDRLGYRGADLASRDASPRVPGATRAGDVRSDGRVVELGPGAVARLRVPVDLGGIGKGLALRWAAARAAAALPAGATGLVEAGGDLVALGRRRRDDPWLVGIEDPAEDGEELAIVALWDGALATSSIGVHRWTDADGGSVHHLVDPASGAPGGAGLLAVTVAAPDPAWAEVWSKTLFLEGRARIGPVARGRGIAAWWVAEDGTLEMTPAARERTAWLARESGVVPPARGRGPSGGEVAAAPGAVAAPGAAGPARA